MVSIFIVYTNILNFFSATKYNITIPKGEQWFLIEDVKSFSNIKDFRAKKCSHKLTKTWLETFECVSIDISLFKLHKKAR